MCLAEILQNEMKEVRVSQFSPDGESMGWVLIGGGFVSALFIIIRGRRWIYLLLFPLVLIAIGISLLLRQRQTNIQQVEATILTELDTLGPVARAQVLKKVTEKEFNKYVPEKK